MYIKRFLGTDEEEEKKEQERKLVLPRRKFLLMLPGILVLPKLIQEVQPIVVKVISDPIPFTPSVLESLSASGGIYFSMENFQREICRAFQISPEKLGLK